MVKPVAARGLHNLVVQQLGRLIVSGELAPGSGLPREEVLAERLQVSRTALREAMKVLVAKGLIKSRQRTGARVRDEVNWNQLDADVLGWRCASMPTDSFVEKLVEMRELIVKVPKPKGRFGRAHPNLPVMYASVRSLVGLVNMRSVGPTSTSWPR